MSVVAMDCEKVKSSKGPLLAKVSIVDSELAVLLNTFVKPDVNVTDYYTELTGITKQDLAGGMKLSSVRSVVANLLKGKVLVGHSLQDDLKVLGLCHPDAKKRDLAEYKPFMTNKNEPQKLKLLASKYINMDIQVREHDSLEDAIASMKLYKSVAPNWK